MKKSQQPTKDMEKLIALGNQKGFLTYDEVNDLLPEDLSSTVAIDHLFELLGNEEIRFAERLASASPSTT
jgi:RNA polymerase primary sigma factor